VLCSLKSPLDDTVPAARAITVEDLLTFRLGFGIIIVPPGTYPIQEAEAELGLMTLGPLWPPPPFGLTGIVLSTRAMTWPEPPAHIVEFWDAAYGALAP
jgi:hypothetical protein